MHYWNTGDRATDCNLQRLESIRNWQPNPDGRSVEQLLFIVMSSETMLPAAAKRHFQFPNPYVGSAHYDLGQSYRDNLVAQIIKAIREGLDRAAADLALQKGGGADLSDRPRSQGEAILDALAEYETSRSSTALFNLGALVRRSPFHSRMKTIDMLATRKRPYGNQSPEGAMASELFRLRSEAQQFHSQKAD